MLRTKEVQVNRSRRLLLRHPVALIAAWRVQKLLRNGSDSSTVSAAELERLAYPVPALEGDMDMRMLRVVVNYGDPFQLGTKCSA